MLVRKISYSDLPFFLSKNSFTDDFNLTKNLNAIKQSVKNLISTNYGERKFNYKLGGNIYDKLFENYSYEVVSELQNSIGGTIQEYESRIELTQIIVLNTGENELSVVVRYFIPLFEVKDEIVVKLARTR
jgi:phage baseplate assembly protein W